MVYRIYVEKKEGLANEADALCAQIRDFLGIQGLQKVRLLNRYDVEGLSKELFDRAVRTVFSEPQLDNVTEALGKDEAVVFAVEYLPGQFMSSTRLRQGKPRLQSLKRSNRSTICRPR